MIKFVRPAHAIALALVVACKLTFQEISIHALAESP